MRLHRWALGILFAGLAMSQNVSAQERFSTITGTVVDTTGAPVPGATVTLTNLDTQRIITRTTDSGGNYAAREIEPGRYSIKYELTGFSTVEVADVNLLLGKSLKIPATLAVGAVTETIQVIGESPLIDVGSTLRGNNIPAEEFEKIPKGRSFESLAAGWDAR